MLHCVSVPPISTSLCVLFANMQGNNTACKSNVMLPAVPMSIVRFLAFILPGTNNNSLLPSSAPSAFALHSCCNAFTHCTCCAFSPEFFLPERMFVALKGIPVRLLSASAVLTICPPPSPWLPSRIIIIAVKRCLI